MRGVEFRRNAFQVTPDMVAAVLEVAPHVPARLVQEDLRETGSINRTIENIFEGRLIVPEEPDFPEHRPLSPARGGATPFTRMDAPTSINEEIERLESTLLVAPTGFASSASERQKLLDERKKALQQKSRL